MRQWLDQCRRRDGIPLSFAEMEATLQAIREGTYWPSQRDAIAALELAVEVVREDRGDEANSDFKKVEALIFIGLERLRRMGR